VSPKSSPKTSPRAEVPEPLTILDEKSEAAKLIAFNSSPPGSPVDKRIPSSAGSGSPTSKTYETIGEAKEAITQRNSNNEELAEDAGNVIKKKSILKQSSFTPEPRGSMSPGKKSVTKSGKGSVYFNFQQSCH
jgi:hypothetical protein